jgi:hypothetical protein
MRYQDYIIEATQRAAEEAMRYARAVPVDKLDWKVLGEGRSVLDQAREMAKTPDWAYDIIAGSTSEWNEETMEQQRAEMEQWKSIDDCMTVCNEKLRRLFDLYRSIPDEQLTETKWLRYEGGRDFMYLEMMDYPRWNFNYHVGQIAFIQTLYGDKEMH